MKLTSEMRIVAMQAKSVEELLTLAEENGYSVSKEEAEEIYAELNKEGELSDEELENVAGGACYSKDEGHNLIVTIGNRCKGFEQKPNVSLSSCLGCKHVYRKSEGSLTMYCNIRTKGNDPYK